MVNLPKLPCFEVSEEDPDSTEYLSKMLYKRKMVKKKKLNKINKIQL